MLHNNSRDLKNWYKAVIIEKCSIDKTRFIELSKVKSYA